MRISFGAAALALAGLLSGCNSSGPQVSVMVANGPHHGTMIPLPDDKGFVEFVNEPEIADRRNPQPTSIVVYFLQADAQSPISPAPSDVRFAIDTGGGRAGRAKTGSAQSIPLAAEPRPDDPAGASRFASKAGSYELSALRGNLTAMHAGQEISTSFAGGR